MKSIRAIVGQRETITADVRTLDATLTERLSAK